MELLPEERSCITCLKHNTTNSSISLPSIVLKKITMYGWTALQFVTSNCTIQLFQKRLLYLMLLIEPFRQWGDVCLKRWLALPLKNLKQIQKRHEIVKYLINNDDFYQTATYQIKQISDIERLISKVATAKINPREVVLLKDSLKAILPVKEASEKSNNTSLKSLGKNLFTCQELIDKITDVIRDDAPVNINKGNVIAEGVSNELDELRNIANSGKEISRCYVGSRNRTNRHSLVLKLLLTMCLAIISRYVIHIKIKVPEEWIRKQTLVNAERYITEELKEYETKILGAEEKIGQLEQQLFTELLHFMVGYIQQVQQNAQQIAYLDCLCSFAQLAKDNNYVCPTDG